MANTSSSEPAVPHTPSTNTLKPLPVTSLFTIIIQQKDPKNKIIQSENNKRKVSRMNDEKFSTLNSSKITPDNDQYPQQHVGTQTPNKTILTKSQTVEASTEFANVRKNYAEDKDFYAKREKIKQLKLVRQNNHSVNKNINNFYEDQISNEKSSLIGPEEIPMSNHHVTVKKSLNIKEETFLIPKFISTEQSIPNFNIGTDNENLTPSTHTINQISDETTILTNDPMTTETTFLSIDKSISTLNSEEILVNDFKLMSSTATLINLPTPHVYSNVMKTNFLSSQHEKTDGQDKVNKRIEPIDTRNQLEVNGFSKPTILKDKSEGHNGNNPKLSVPVEEKIEDTVFYTDIVDPEDQFDKKNEIYKNNYLDQNEYQAILDKFFNGKKQNRKMNVPKNILSIDKLLEQNTKKPTYFTNEDQTIERTTDETTKNNGSKTVSKLEGPHNLKSFVKNSTEDIQNSSKKEIPQAIIFKDLDSMSAAQDTNPFIHWDDINENQQLESYRRKNKDWFILQLTGK